MRLFAEVLVASLMVIGAFFLLVGSYGLAKLPDFMRRLHGPSKATTLGIGATLLSSMFYFLIVKLDLSLHELLIVVFLFLTAPISANMLGKVHILAHHREMDLPPTGGGSGWATLAEPREPDQAQGREAEPRT